MGAVKRREITNEAFHNKGEREIEALTDKDLRKSVVLLQSATTAFFYDQAFEFSSAMLTHIAIAISAFLIILCDLRYFILNKPYQCLGLFRVSNRFQVPYSLN